MYAIFNNLSQCIFKRAYYEIMSLGRDVGCTEHVFETNGRGVPYHICGLGTLNFGSITSDQWGMYNVQTLLTPMLYFNSSFPNLSID